MCLFKPVDSFIFTVAYAEDFKCTIISVDNFTFISITPNLGSYLVDCITELLFGLEGPCLKSAFILANYLYKICGFNLPLDFY